MTLEAPSDSPRGLTSVQWLICVIAAIGFAFDIYELLMLPLILRDALLELGGIQPNSDRFNLWLALLFYVPAVAGGIFGLLGGYLTDRLGRRRVLTWSILLYAFSAFFAGFSTNLYMLLFFRTTTFIGVCVEFVAAVAWLAELFPNPKRREAVLGYTQAFSSIGGFLVAGANKLAIAYAASLPAIGLPDWLTFGGDIANPHAAWRYTLMSGLIPAIPLIIIRPFLPESPAWREKKAAGTLKRPGIGQLFSPQLARTTILTTIMFACSYGAAFGAIQQIPQIIPGAADVAATVKQAVAEKTADIADEATRKKVAAQTAAAVVRPHVPDATLYQEIGGLVGRVILAGLVIYFGSRPFVLRFFQVPGLLLFPILFGVLMLKSVNVLYWCAFVAALVTVAQFSFWGNYLPRVYPLHLRGTGESFAANIGGRMIGTSFAAVTGGLAAYFTADGASPAEAARVMAYTAAGVGFFVYLVGLICSFFLPDPAEGSFDDDTPPPAVAAATGVDTQLVDRGG
jgi:MFS family permease